MALSKTGFQDATIGTATYTLPISKDSESGQSWFNPNGSDSQKWSFKNISADATATQVDNLFEAFATILGDNYYSAIDSQLTTFSVKWEHGLS